MDNDNGSAVTAMRVVRHLAQVQADLLEAKATMAERLASLVSRLPPGDPDRSVLLACVHDLTLSVRRQRETLATGPWQSSQEDGEASSRSRPLQ
jgi:hypothetical protein